MTTTSLYVSSAGADARLKQLEMVANNLANADTDGFRADAASFGRALTANLESADAERSLGLHVFVNTQGPGVRHVSGPVTRTGGDLDVAIDGPGFFSVQTPAGVRYTRAGGFQVDPAGQLISTAGHPVLGDGGPINVGPGAARIDADGQIVSATGGVLGRVAVDLFEDPSQLSKAGENLFEAPPLARRQPAGVRNLVPGSVETSNVKPMQELAHLVVLQRAFDASMEALQADDAASNRLIQEMNR
ncbi:MAG: flagellar basal-body rod protein FlgF [Myxococcota bacterium]